MSDLFRREAVAHATRRLEGNVVLATPLSVRLVGAVLAAIVLGALVFATLTSYARKATLVGWIVPDRGIIRASSQASGLIERLHVKEGARVEHGAPIAEILVAAESTSGNTGRAVVAALKAEAEAAEARAKHAMRRLVAEEEQVRRRIEALGRELVEAGTQVRLLTERVRLARALVRDSEGLASRGHLPGKELNNRKSAALTVETELAGQRRASAALEREQSDLKARLTVIPIEMQQAEADYSLSRATLAQRSAEADGRRLQLVLAPIAGRIAALPALAGQPVAAGQVIAVVIPEGGRLEAELLAPSRAIGFIRSGLEVQLLLQAFPHQRFGILRGTVSTVSNTVLAPAEIAMPGLAQQEPMFRVRVALEREQMEAYGERFALQPGMLLSADVIFDRRSLIEWLLDPIYSVRRAPS